MQHIKSLYCPKCQKLIGDVYIDRGKVYCLIGSVLARVFIHNCPVCRRQFHWHAEQIEKQVENKKPLKTAVSRG